MKDCLIFAVTIINTEINRPGFVSFNVVGALQHARSLARSLARARALSHTHTLMDTGARVGGAKSVLDRAVLVGVKSLEVSYSGTSRLHPLTAEDRIHL